ncbi:MAG: hypothetical protein H0W76_12190 [Pyrinomonadaceae bacterium]|nr:hypothetical protein [Pyrinomonadaceae bacterium]
MRFSVTFFKATAVCAILSGVTTLGVHLLPPTDIGAMNFEQRIALHSDSFYIFRLWVVVLHILLVVASMWGVAAKKLNTSAGVIVIGFLGYLLFALSELLRTSVVLFAVNRAWRAQYAQETSEAVRAMLRANMIGWAGVSEALFFLLLLGFFIGNLFYGLAFVRGTGLEKTVGVVLLVWSAITLTGIAGDYIEISSVPQPSEWVAWTFQPLARLLVGAWLWKSSAVEVKL